MDEHFIKHVMKRRGNISAASRPPYPAKLFEISNNQLWEIATNSRTTYDSKWNAYYRMYNQVDTILWSDGYSEYTQ